MSPRIVSLLPSATEIVYALGLGDYLLGVTDECEVPAGCVPPAVVVRGKQPPGLSAAEVDEWVRAHAAAGGLYLLDEAAIAAIRPDLVLTQDLCRVCAVPSGDVDAALSRLSCPSTVVTLEPSRLDEVVESVRTVAAAAGFASRGTSLARQLRGRLGAVAHAVSGLEPVPTLVLEWLDPPFTAGHWVPDVVTAAGGASVAGVAGGRSVATTWERLAAVGAEHVVLAPCGMTPADTWEQAPSLVPAALLALPCVAADLARPGPGLVDRVEGLAAVLHPSSGLPRRAELVMPRPVDPVGLHPGLRAKHPARLSTVVREDATGGSDVV